MNSKYLTLLLALLSCSIFHAQVSRLESEINKIISFDSDISYELTPGFIVGVMDGDSIYYVSFGKHKSPFTGKIGEDDVFEIGSISKTMSAAVISVMANQGKISLNDKVNHFLPIEYQNPRLASLTLAQLMNHNTALPRRPSMFGEKEDDAQNPYAHYTKEDLLNYYSQYVPDKGIEFNYSHTNYALLELVIESACECDFNAAVEAYLLNTLEMNNTFVELKEKKDGVISPGVDRTLTLAQPWTCPSFAAAEGIKSTASDLIRFVKPFMAMSASPLDHYFPDLTKDIHPSFNEKLFYSTGWHGIRINKRIKALVSNGTTSGHSAFIGMVPETKTAVVVLSNSSYGTKDLGLLILRMINYNWKRKTQ